MHQPNHPSLTEDLANARKAEILRCERHVSETYFENESDDHRFLRVHIDATFSQIELLLSELRISDATQGTSYQLGISASFLRTDHILRRQIASGNLIEAMILMRKQIELLARFRELDTKSPEELRGKTPNVSALKNIGGIGRLYGALSGVAHFSDVYVTELLGASDSACSAGWSIQVFPTYQKSAHDLFQDYCILCIYFSSAIGNSVPKWDSDTDRSLMMALGEHIAVRAREMGFFGSES